jgi:hypothetical protein
LIDIKQLAATSQVALLAAVGQESEGANPHESIRQHMKQETANELIGVQRHLLELIVIFSVAI